MTIDFLLRGYAASDEDLLKPTIPMLRAMSRGGMYDVVGGGFSRDCVDNFWRVPHFNSFEYGNGYNNRSPAFAGLLLQFIYGLTIGKRSTVGVQDIYPSA